MHPSNDSFDGEPSGYAILERGMSAVRVMRDGEKPGCGFVPESGKVEIP